MRESPGPIGLPPLHGKGRGIAVHRGSNCVNNRASAECDGLVGTALDRVIRQF